MEGTRGYETKWKKGYNVLKKTILFRKEREQTGIEECWIEPIQFPVSLSECDLQQDGEC